MCKIAREAEKSDDEAQIIAVQYHVSTDYCETDRLYVHSFVQDFRGSHSTVKYRKSYLEKMF